MIAYDRQLQREGKMSAEEVDIDIQLSKLEPQLQPTIDSHDKAKAQALYKKYQTLLARKEVLARQYLATHPRPPSSDGPDPCLSPMGKNICAPAQPMQTQRMCSVNYGSVTALEPC
jgi:hypothetical protein